MMAVHLANLVLQVAVFAIYEAIQMILHPPWDEVSSSLPSSNIRECPYSQPALLVKLILEEILLKLDNGILSLFC